MVSDQKQLFNKEKESYHSPPARALREIFEETRGLREQLVRDGRENDYLRDWVGIVEDRISRVLGELERFDETNWVNEEQFVKALAAVVSRVATIYSQVSSIGVLAYQERNELMKRLKARTVNSLTE